MINSSIIKTTIKEAQKSNFRHRHGCVIFNGSRIIATGFNEIRYCSKLNKKYRKFINSLHAEQKTILFTQSPIKRCSLLIIRINKENKLVNSKPCKMCQALIADVGITKVYYSNKLNQIQMLEAK
jgi:deoxycytidylate deaminase